MFVHIIPNCDFNINNISLIDKFICVKMDNHYFPPKNIYGQNIICWIVQLFESIINDFCILN